MHNLYTFYQLNSSSTSYIRHVRFVLNASTVWLHDNLMVFVEKVERNEKRFQAL